MLQYMEFFNNFGGWGIVFDEIKPNLLRILMSEPMKKYRCTVCEYVYDPAVGDPENGIPAGTPFEQLPAGWICPVCGEGKEVFDPID